MQKREGPLRRGGEVELRQAAGGGAEAPSGAEAEPPAGDPARSRRRAGKRSEPQRRRFTPDERRAAVEAFTKSGRTRTDFARLWGCSPSSLDKWLKAYRAGGPKALEPKPRGKRGPRPAQRTVPEEVRDEVVRAQTTNPHWGLRRIQDFLLRFRGAKVSEGTVRNVLRERGVARPEGPGRRARRRASPPRRFERARPGELWQSDITSYVLPRSGRRVYLTVFLDDCAPHDNSYHVAMA